MNREETSSMRLFERKLSSAVIGDRARYFCRPQPMIYQLKSNRKSDYGHSDRVNLPFSVWSHVFNPITYTVKYIYLIVK